MMTVVSRRVSVRAVVLHEGKLLCVKLKKYAGSIQIESNLESDFWCLPGGGLEAGESITDGVVREMLEETGVRPVVGNLLYVQQFDYKGTEYMEFFFHVTNAEDYLDVDLSKTTHGNQEIAAIDFVDTSANNVLPKFLTTEPLTDVADKGIAKFYSYL